MTGSQTVQPMIEPDPDQMLRHLEHLLGGDLDGCHEGKIELAWNGADGCITFAHIFGTDQLEDLAEKAVRENRVPGRNVYIGQALRKPDIPPFGRCGDEDFYALTTFYVDLDDDVLARARINYRHRGCPPTGVVVTGRHPHVRAQMLWRQETPERNPDNCRRQNLALASSLGGDTAVINPGRVMRLGGSIAWPHKPGRILERTEFLTFDDDRPKVYYPGQLAKAFPPEEARKDVPEPEPRKATTLAIGAEFDGVTVDSCLAAIRVGDHWHNNLVRLTGHWIARGWSDVEILTAAEGLTLPGYTVDQTRREVTAMIKGGRAKWNVADPEHVIDQEIEIIPPLAPAFIEDLNVAMLPRRRWILGNTMLRGHVTVLVAPPGVGKSTLGIEQAVAIVTGKEITGQAVHEQARVWVYNNEDDADELKRRLAAVLQNWEIPLSAVKGKLALNSGADRPLLAARMDRDGKVVHLPDVDACIEHILAHGIGAFFVDPFAETHEVNENANEQIKVVAGMFREIARKGNCSVVLAHHTAKPPQGSSDGHAGNMNTARGATALVGIARVVQTLFSMRPRDADRYGIDEEERHLHIRLDDAKANFALASEKARWFKREGLTLANDDEVGILVPQVLEPLKDQDDAAGADLHRTIITCLLAKTSEEEITLNAAAKLLAWSGDERFAQYRETDAKGNQRASRPFRETILAACRSGVCVVNNGRSKGFTRDETRKPVTLRRFENPATVTEVASQKPEFMEEE